jgi:hypothetical protein
VHALQTPPPQNWFTPQLVPSVTLPLSVQTGAPLEQTFAAVWHELVEVQVAPAVQATQVPAPSQTSLVPQLVPGAWSPVVAVQTGAPVEQEFVPRRHAFEAG